MTLRVSIGLWILTLARRDGVTKFMFVLAGSGTLLVGRIDNPSYGRVGSERPR